MTANFYLYSTAGTSTVAWTFVNIARPTWGYIINTQQVTFSSNTYVSSWTVGTGILASKIPVIFNILRQVESQYSTCLCFDLDKINQLLYDFDGNRWNVLCKDKTSYFITGRVRNDNLQYFVEGPATSRCNYLLWVIWVHLYYVSIFFHFWPLWPHWSIDSMNSINKIRFFIK